MTPGARRYSILRALPLSFFSRDLYRDVAENWRGAGLTYLLILVALPTALLLIRVQSGLLQWAHGDGLQVVNQIPPIQIEHGVVRVDRPMPVIIKEPGKDVALAIIDTSGSITSLEGSEARVLLTRNLLYLRKSDTETRVFDLSRVESFSMDRDRAVSWLGGLVIWLAVFLAPFILFGLYVFRLMQQLIGSVIGLLVARLSPATLDFRARMRLVAVALTPALLAETALDLVNKRPPVWGLLWTIIAVTYIVLAIRWSGNEPAQAPAVEAPTPDDAERDPR